MSSFLYYFVATLHVLVCVILVVIVLLQTGKGADLGALAGGGSNTVFGSRGPTTFFHYLTTGSAVIFMVTSMFLSCSPGPNKGGGSVIDETPTPSPTATAATLGTAGAATMTTTTAK